MDAQKSRDTLAATVAQPAGPSLHPTLLGESYGFWCQTSVLLSATVFAWLAIKNSRAIEKKKAASAALFASRRDKDLQIASSLIVKLHNGDKNIGLFARKENHGTPESQSVKYALNHYEYISVGIAEDIFDENVFKSGVYTTVTNLYDRTMSIKSVQA